MNQCQIQSWKLWILILVQLYGEQIDDILSHISSILGLALSYCVDSLEERIKMMDAIASLTKIKTLFT